MNSYKKQHRLEVLAQSHGLAMVFITLVITLSLLVAAYWLFSLEPRLTTQAKTQANTLAQAHAGILAKSLSAEPEFISLELEQAMDSILLVRDPAIWTPVIHRIELEIDFTVIDTKPDTLELARGEAKCTDCFISEIPLFHEKQQILVGIARFYAGREFLDTLISDIQQKLWWSGAIIMLLIGFAWIVIESFLHKMNKSKSNLQSIIDAVADPLYVFSTERELILQNHAASELSTSSVGIDDDEFHKYIIPSNEMSQDVIQNDRPVKCIHKIPQSHDRFRRMELQASPLSDGDNNSTGIVVTYRDITEHLEVLDELQIKKHQLQQLAEKDTLTELPNRFMFNSLLGPVNTN